MTPVDPNNLIRVESWHVQNVLMWEGRDFWLVPNKCDVRCLSIMEKWKARGRPVINPPHLVKVNSAERLKAAAELLNSLMASLKNGGDDFPAKFDPSAQFAGKWATVVASAFARTVGEFIGEHCSVRLGREPHFYFEHPAAVDLVTLAAGCDWLRDQPGFHVNPSGPLVVPFYDSFQPPGLRMPAISRLYDLPRWKTRAPASLMMRAKRSPSLNTAGTGSGRRLVYQTVYRQSDIVSLWGWLGIPWQVYFKPLPTRHYPKGYVRESLKQSSTVHQGDASGLG